MEERNRKKMRTATSAVVIFVVFISGGVVMAFEIVGSRVMAPTFGSSTIVWTALIGIILGALSLGYWIGGVLSDRKPRVQNLGLILLGAGLSIALMALIKDPVLTWAALAPNFHVGVMSAATILFAPASFVLGMVSPYAARLAMVSIEGSGKIIGNLYAFSTLGSIVGTFLAGFVLLPVLGNTTLLFSLAASEVLLALLLFSSHRLKGVAALIAFALLLVAGASGANADLALGPIDIDTQYSRVRIFSDTDRATQRPVLRMNINDGFSSAMFLDTEDPTELAYSYTRFYRLADHFVPNLQSALMIGGAAYSFPKDFLASHESAELDVVEIDPKVTQLAEEYFRLDPNHPRLHIFHEDGRTFLNRDHMPYDAIYLDAFHSNAVPYQLASVEAMERTHDLLTDRGVFIANVISPINGEDGKFFRALYRTMREVYPQVEIFPVNEVYDPKLVGNVMLVGFVSTAELNLTSDDAEMTEMLNNLRRQAVALDVPVLTDEHNPADYYSSAYLDHLNRQ